MKNNLGKWDSDYKNLKVNNPGAFRYGDTVTYLMGASYLANCDCIEDWGCGAGGFKRYCKTVYIGIDGSKTPFADIITDLTMYRPQVSDGRFMRHILEHNFEWDKILDNFLSAGKMHCLILFTPFSDTTHAIVEKQPCGMDVPDISFNKMEIESVMLKHNKKWILFENLKTNTQYGIEHVYLIK